MVPRVYAQHDVFIETVRKVVASELAPHVDEWEAAGHFPNEVFKLLGRNGFLGILIPEEYGGVGGDYLMASAWCETFGELRAVGLTVGVNMHSVVVSNALNKYGSLELKKKWLPGAVKGDLIGAYAFTEPNAGSDLARARTKAVRDGKDWILNGSKTFITNGARASFVLVLARNDFEAGYGGFTTFLVDTSAPGFKVSRKLDKLGWRSSDTAELVLENVRVPDSCVLGKVGEGWNQAANSLNWERMMLTLTALGGGRACFRETLKYSKERSAFGKPIIEFDAVSSNFSDMYRRLRLGEAFCHYLVERINGGNESKSEVSIAKRLVCDDMVWLADQAIQIHGGYGYTTEFPPERWWRDLRLMPIGGGTSEIMANIVVKEENLTG